MKKLAAALVALALLFVGLSYYVSMRAETEYQKLISQWSSPGDYTLELVSYERGLFQSEATTLLRFDLGPAAMDPDAAAFSAFQFQDVLHHGPCSLAMGKLVTVDTSVFFETEPPLYRELFGEAAILQLNTLVPLSGDPLDMEITSPELVHDQEGETLHWKGISGTMHLAADRASFSLQSPGLTMTGVQGDAELSTIRFNAEMTPHATGLWLGEQTLEIDGLTFSAQGQEVVMGKNLKLRGTSRAEGNLATGEASYALETLNVLGQAYAPSDIEFRFKNLDLEGVKRYEELLEQAAEDPNSEQALLAKGLAGAAKHLLPAKPEMEISRMEITTPDGMVRGTARLGVAEAADMAVLDPADPYAPVRTLELDAQFSIPAALVTTLLVSEAQSEAFGRLAADPSKGLPDMMEVQKLAEAIAAEQLAMFEKQGFLTRDGNDYRLVATGREGVLEINGNLIPLPM